MTKKILSALLALCAAAGSAPLAATESSAPSEPQASIPFVHDRTITTFEAVDDDTVYLRARGRWYRAELLGRCIDLPWAIAIGVDTGPTTSLDRFGALIVGRDRCPLQSLVESRPPERRARRR